MRRKIIVLLVTLSIAALGIAGCTIKVDKGDTNKYPWSTEVWHEPTDNGQGTPFPTLEPEVLP